MKKILFAILTVSIAFLASCNKKNEPENSDAPQNDETSGTVKDICGNTYKYVKIGSQYWMAENMRCNKYDTQSERPNGVLSTSNVSIWGPHYTDARDKSMWDKDKRYTTAENLTDSQIQKFGYHYTWAAVVGLATEAAAISQVSAFNGHRQGICPNNWHVPTKAEWDELIKVVGGEIVSGGNMKTTSGWHENGNGMDKYGFSALPAGYEYGSVCGVGNSAYFWTATPNNVVAYGRIFFSDRSDSSYNYDGKFQARNVRCVKD